MRLSLFRLLPMLLLLITGSAGTFAQDGEQEVYSPLEREVISQDDLQPERESRSETPLFLWLLVPLAVAAFLRSSFEKDLAERWTALINRNLAQQVYRDREFALHPRSLLLQLLFMLAMGTWLAGAAQQLSVEVPGWGGWRLYVLAILSVALFATLRDALRRAVGALWRLDDEVGFFNFHVMLLNGLAGLMLLPFLFIMLLSSAQIAWVATLISLVLLLILFAIRSFIGLQLGSGYFSRNPIHFVLYICSLEIAPVLLLYEGLSGWFTVS